MDPEGILRRHADALSELSENLRSDKDDEKENTAELEDDQAPVQTEPEDVIEKCKRSKKGNCIKKGGHPGKCKIVTGRKFWEFTSNYAVHVIKQREEAVKRKRVEEEAVEVEKRRVTIKELNEVIVTLREQCDNHREITESMRKDFEEEKKTFELKTKEVKTELDNLRAENDKLKLIFEQRASSRTRRENNPTTFEIITSRSSSMRFERKKESKNVLEYIHGGQFGALLGAWDYLQTNVDRSLMNKLVMGYKKGKFIQYKLNELTKKYETSDEVLQRAIVMKYENFLSRRKYRFLSRTMDSFYDPNKKTWLPRNNKIDGVSIRYARQISHNRIQRFAQNLDIGDVYNIPGHIGVARPMTALVVMIVDLNLRLSHLRSKLVWFNDQEGVFVVQFSDDGAPETNDLTMSLGTLTLWNFGSLVRSRAKQYLLHALSVAEKDEVMGELWQQHCEEMKAMEGSYFTINGQRCEFEFVPSADQAWQTWAANEVNQAATYPSPYGNVCQATMSQVNGSLGDEESCTWQVWSEEQRNSNVIAVEEKKRELSKTNLSPKQQHDKLLQFLRENAMRTLGKPRIDMYINKLKPEVVILSILLLLLVLSIPYILKLKHGTFCVHATNHTA